MNKRGNMAAMKEERITLHLAGLTAAEIGRRTGFCQAAVASWLNRHGYKPNGGQGGARIGAGRRKRVHLVQRP